MEKTDYNEKAINDAYKNAHLALQSISDLMPQVEQEDLKSELSEEYEGYEKIIGEISSYMKEEKIEPKDVNPFKKAMLWSSIKMKTIFDNSSNTIAEMMINGTVMGINELQAMQNEKVNLEKKISDHISNLLKFEEGCEERLKKYL